MCKDVRCKIFVDEIADASLEWTPYATEYYDAIQKFQNKGVRSKPAITAFVNERDRLKRILEAVHQKAGWITEFAKRQKEFDIRHDVLVFGQGMKRKIEEMEENETYLEADRKRQRQKHNGEDGPIVEEAEIDDDTVLMPANIEAAIKRSLVKMVRDNDETYDTLQMIINAIPCFERYDDTQQHWDNQDEYGYEEWDAGENEGEVEMGLPDAVEMQVA